MQKKIGRDFCGLQYIRGKQSAFSTQQAAISGERSNSQLAVAGSWQLAKPAKPKTKSKAKSRNTGEAPAPHEHGFSPKIIIVGAVAARTL
jgi:hypothetical protein